MPVTTTLAPITIDGEPVAVGEEIELSDEEYANLRAEGKVTASAEEVKANAQTANPQGVYTARTGREDVASTKAADEPPREKK